MECETDCSSLWRSLDLVRTRKLQKKYKKKEKKSKKHKKEKKKSHKKKEHSRKQTRSSGENLDINIHNLNIHEPTTSCDNNEGVFGPALPPHLQKETEKVNKSNDLFVIGPVIPKDILERKRLFDLETKEMCKDEKKNSLSLESDDDAMQGSYGPLPVTNEREMSAAQIELEQRALQLKMAAIDGTSTTVSEQNVREEWMLELPNVGLKGGLAALTNLKRGFYQGKEKPDFSDRSSWTKTPQTKSETHSLNPLKRSKEELEQQVQALYIKQRDDEQEAIAKNHKRKPECEESLVEMHQKKLRKEEKKKANELKASGDKLERRPFTRDIDLKLNKIDRNQTKQIVDKAKILNTKFSAGQTKYL